jgi:hypothetical protein
MRDHHSCMATEIYLLVLRVMHMKIGALWKKIALPVLALLATNVILTFVLTYTVSDLFFIEGAAVLGIGTLVVSQSASTRMKHPETAKTSTEEKPRNQEKDGERRISLGWILIIIGAILLGLSVLSSLLPR